MFPWGIGWLTWIGPGDREQDHRSGGRERFDVLVVALHDDRVTGNGGFDPGLRCELGRPLAGKGFEGRLQDPGVFPVEGGGASEVVPFNDFLRLCCVPVPSSSRDRPGRIGQGRVSHGRYVCGEAGASSLVRLLAPGDVGVHDARAARQRNYGQRRAVRVGPEVGVVVDRVFRVHVPGSGFAECLR